MPSKSDNPEAGNRPSLVSRLTTALEARQGVPPVAIGGLFLIAFFAVLYVGRSIFIPLALASMFYFLLRPAVRLFGALRVPKAVASAVLVGGLVLVLAGLVFQSWQPAGVWFKRLPAAMRTLEQRVRPLRQPVERASQLAERVERAAQVKSDRATQQVVVQEQSLLDSLMSAAAELVAEALVMLIALYFMLIYGDTLLQRLLCFLPELSERERTASVLNEIERRMSQYLRTITAINVVLGAATGVIMMALGMPNPWLWAVFSALSNYVPYLGAMTVTIVLGLVSFVSFQNPWQAIVPPLSYLLLTTIEGNFITPWIVGRAFSVSPLVVFVWLVFWSWIWGVAGAIVAVPLLMLIKITCEQSESLVWLSELIEK